MASNKRQRKQSNIEAETQQQPIEETQPEQNNNDDNDNDDKNNDNNININNYINNIDNNEELPHKSRVDKGKEIETTPSNKEKETSATTSTGPSFERQKLKTDRLSYIISQALQKELMKSESSVNHKIDYCRTTNALKSISDLVEKQSQLNQEQRRIDTDMKKILNEVSKDIMNTEVLDEDLNWSHIIDISKKGRGLYVHYSDGSRESYAKITEYMNLKAIEMKKFPDKELFVIDKNMMDKITNEYISREDCGVIMDNIGSIISAHKNNKELFDTQFYDEFFQEDVITCL